MAEIPAENICLIRLSALGDTMHALAFVNQLRTGYPRAHISWILEPLPYEIVKHQSVVDEFIVFNPKSGFRAWLDLKRQLRNYRFDLLILPQLSFRSSLTAAMVNAEIKLGFDFRRSRELHWFFTNRHIPAHPPQHSLDLYFEFLDYLGIPRKPVEWNLEFTAEEISWREQFFSRFDRPVIAFVAASSNPEKDWSPEGYARVMDHVHTNLGLQPVVVGGPSRREREFADRILECSRTAPVIALEKPIRHTMLQLSGARLVVAPDTGPLHIAVALGIPTVSLYGYSNPRRCGPYRKYADLLIDKYSDTEQETGIARKTKPGRMQRITPGEVIEKIELELNRNTGICSGYYS